MLISSEFRVQKSIMYVMKTNTFILCIIFVFDRFILNHMLKLQNICENNVFFSSRTYVLIYYPELALLWRSLVKINWAYANR